MYLAALDHDEERRRHLRIGAGIAISLAMHAALLTAWRNNTVRIPDQPEPPRSIAVWLRPPPPVPEPAPVPRALPAPQKAAPPVRERSPARPRRRAPAPAEPVARKEENGPAAPVGPQAPTPAEPAPARRFDLDGARRFARRIASEPDPARRDTAVGQFPEPGYRTEDKAARAISSAKRRDCKDGIPGGLLAPLFLMLDKKDSGCKW